ncbi:MAG TPA: Wzz/FepE/Etk N-terminal domain-containing protein [Novosphingobium sp.]|nr:Wzz/FepE/Etk N-terminal domain-containing protein [Novosphingobium sp.]
MNPVETNEGGGLGVLFRQMPSILWQRRWIILGVWLVGLVLAAVALAVIPTEYRSRAIMVVQPPQVPEEMIGNAIGDNVERRLETIRQQIISRPDLIAIINRNGLYARDRTLHPLSDVIDKMRKNILLAPIASPSGGDQGNNPQEVAFEMSFDYPDPDAARAVAQQLMERIVSFYSARNSAQASNAVDYLGSQQAALQRQISEVEQQLNTVTSENGRALAGISSPVINAGSGGADAMILQLQRENSELVLRKSSSGGDPRSAIVSAAEAQLAAARAMYSDNHPDVVQARQRLAEAKRLASEGGPSAAGASIDQQIAFNNAQIASLRAQTAQDRAQAAMALSAQTRGPAAQQAVSALQQRLSGLNQQYQAISAKYLAAQANARANDEQLGRQLTIIEPPTIPDKPYSPNRLLIVAAGMIGGLGLGFLAALAVELLTHPIRHPDTIARLTGMPPLGVVPDVRQYRQHRARRGIWPFRRRARRTASAAALAE